MNIYLDIKKELLDNYEEINNSADPIALVMEYAEGWLPIYNHEILKAWGEMPSTFNDSWQEVGYQKGQGIFELMTWDLATWYSDTGREAWADIEQEKQEAENA
jgi:hypothetical protein